MYDKKGIDMKILVTGANGYIGRYVVKELLEKGHEVIASDINYDGVDERAKYSDVNLFGGDADIYEQYGCPDVCIHMAWRNGFVHNHQSHIEDLPKHYEFIKNMLEGGLPHIVVMGSMHEVGYHEGAIDENTPCNPISLYAIAKNTLRQLTLLKAKEKGAVCQWIRGYYILGDDLKNNSIFSKIVTAANDGKKEFPFTSGKNKYDFMHVTELAKQIAATSTQTKIDGIINCCSGNPISLGEKVESFIKEHNFDIKLNYGAFPDRAYDSPAIWGDASKINEIMKDYE